MELKKLEYLDANSNEVFNVSRKVEFFIHYWEYIFKYPHAQIDKFYLKSHRTVIDKIRLQCDGNFNHSKKFIKIYLNNEEIFSKKNIILKSLGESKERRAIRKIKRLTNLPNPSYQTPGTKIKLSKQISILENWLTTSYSTLISSELKTILAADNVCTKKCLETIKHLTNCFIIELFQKGFNLKFIEQIPQILFDKDRFPFEKIRSDFDTDIAYENYKSNAWQNFHLGDQIEGVINLLNRPLKNRKVVFQIYDINWRHEPLSLLDVEFYNPNEGFNPKCDPNAKFKIFEETFTSGPAEYEKSSRCNAIIAVQGVQENQMINIAAQKVSISLAILNKELNLHGKFYKENVFITNHNFDRILGSVSALHRGFKAVDEVNEFTLDRLDQINQLDLNHSEDKLVLNFVSRISNIFNERNNYHPEYLWITLESTFGEFEQVKDLFNAVMKILYHYNFNAFSRNILRQIVNPRLNLSHPEIDYVFSSALVQKYYLTEKNSLYQIQKFIEIIDDLVNETENLLLQTLVKKIDGFKSDKTQFYEDLDNYVSYLMYELYTQRNLSLHKSMSDDLFLLKETQFRVYTNYLIEFFLYEYFKFPKHRSINSTVSRLINRANQL